MSKPKKELIPSAAAGDQINASDNDPVSLDLAAKCDHTWQVWTYFGISSDDWRMFEITCMQCWHTWSGFAPYVEGEPLLWVPSQGPVTDIFPERLDDHGTQ